MGIVFISYRREDSADTCGRIYDRLVQSFGRERVFKDVDNIPAGVKFAPYLDAKVRECSVQIVVIGPGWLNATTPDARRRLDDPDDFVRIEIESALRRGIPVIPVLVQGASLPTRYELPESLRELTDHQAVQVRRDPDFHHDSQRLAEGLVQWVGAPLSAVGSGFAYTASVGQFAPAQPQVSIYRPAPTPVPVRTSSLAVLSLILSFTGWVSIILGHMALREIKRSNGAIRGRGIALTGLVIGYLIIALYLVYIIFLMYQFHIL